MNYTREQEKAELRKYPKHRLQNKERSKWTGRELHLLFNPNENNKKTRLSVTKTHNKKVIRIKNGITTEYKNVKAASIAENCNYGKIYYAVHFNNNKIEGEIWRKH